jgi:hypothetical protein
MVALSFSVFLDKIIDGSKVNTIRQERKHPIKKGDRLQLYWKQRSPSEGFQIGDAICKEVIPITIDSNAIIMPHSELVVPEALDQFARLDGFENWEGMRLFFNSRYHLPFKGVFIGWQDLELSRTRIDTL